MMVFIMQLFAGGEHIGNGETVIEMNEMGELEELLVDYKVQTWSVWRRTKTKCILLCVTE